MELVVSWRDVAQHIVQLLVKLLQKAEVSRLTCKFVGYLQSGVIWTSTSAAVSQASTEGGLQG